MTSVLLVTEVATEKQQGNNGCWNCKRQQFHSRYVGMVRFIVLRFRLGIGGTDRVLFQIKTDKCTHILLTPLY